MYTQVSFKRRPYIYQISRETPCLSYPHRHPPAPGLTRDCSRFRGEHSVDPYHVVYKR